VTGAQIDIQQRSVQPRLLDELHGLVRPADGPHHMVTKFGQPVGDQQRDERLVIDDKNVRCGIHSMAHVRANPATR
jgi:hypothetical protein